MIRCNTSLFVLWNFTCHVGKRSF